MNQPIVRSFLLSGISLLCLALFVAGTVVAPALEPLPVDPFWPVWAGFPVVRALILIKLDVADETTQQSAISPRVRP